MKTYNTILITSMIILLASCGGKKTTVKEESVRQEFVKTMTIEKSVVSKEVELSTVLQGYEQMSISPSLTGSIEQIFVEVGDNVIKGDKLITMDRRQYNSAKLTFSNLKTEMERMEALKGGGAVSEQAYDQVKLSYQQTKENLDFLEANTFVKAKFAGVISAKNFQDGELYSGMPILVLTQISTLKAFINIPELYFPLIKTGMKVTISSDVYPNKEFPATVEVISPTIDPASHTFQVKLKIPNESRVLRPGMYIRSSLFLDKVEAVIVPYQTVLKLSGSNERFVFLNDGGVAKRVFVTLGQRFDDKIEIISPEISVGDELVVLGQAKLIDGVQLTVKEN